MAHRRLKALAAVVAAAGVLLACMGSVPADEEILSAPRREDAAQLMKELMSGRAEIGGPFTLADPTGRPRSLEEFRGKVVLLYFGYTSCPDVCPTDLALIGAMLRSLGSQGEGVQPIFVTLDPARDTAGALREYAASFHPRFVALRGSEEETRRVASSYKVSYEKVLRPGAGAYVIDHMAFTFLIDRSGKYVAFFPPGTHADRMEVMVREALAAPG